MFKERDEIEAKLDMTELNLKRKIIATHKLKLKKVILEIVKDILVPGFCMAYEVEDENKDYPVMDRWNCYREMWIDSHAKKYGGEKDCRANWEWFINKVKNNAYINARLTNSGKALDLTFID